MKENDQKTIMEYIEDLLGLDGKKINKARKKLRLLGHDATVQLTQWIEDENPEVRCRVVWQLSNMGDPTAYKAVSERVYDNDDRVSYDAILGLGKIKDLQALEILERFIREAESEPVKASAAAMAISKYGSQAIPHLRTIIDSGGIQAKQLAIQSLAALRLKDAKSIVADLLQSPDPYLREISSKALS